MTGHLRANAILLLGTLVLCSVLYPAALWLIGQTVFPEQAQGSLIRNARGEVIGSRLIGQPFKGDEYFQPRPSHAGSGYDAKQSGASNWGASNYLLRDRVARQLGPIVKYGKGAEAFGKKEGDGVQQDIEAWFRTQDGIVEKWAEAHPAVAQAWVKDDDLKKAYVANWLKENPDPAGSKPEDVAVPFFKHYSRTHPGTFPAVVDKAIRPVREGEDIQSYFFDRWRQAHPDVPLEEVPADMVMASGSGLDPHITLANARYQLKHRVAAAQAKKLLRGRDGLRREWEAKWGKPVEEKVREEIEAILQRHKEAPLGGLVGVDLVNVLEVNLALDELAGRFPAN